MEKNQINERKQGFKISKSGWLKAFTYETLPFFIFVPLSIILLFYLEMTFFFVLVLYILIAESLFFLFFGKKAFKIIENEQALIILNNQQHFLFWDKIKHISFRQKGMIILMKTKHKFILVSQITMIFQTGKNVLKSSYFAGSIYPTNDSI